MTEITEIPKEIRDAALLIGNWMKANGHDRWELFDLCSRNHAELVRKLKQELSECSAKLDKCVQADPRQLWNVATFEIAKERDILKAELAKRDSEYQQTQW